MTEAVLVLPVLGRPERVEPLLWSIENGRGKRSYRPLFVCSDGDAEEQREVAGSGADYLVTDWPAGPGDWARKINYAYSLTVEPFLFTGADDLCFCPGWLDRALDCAETSGAGVVGTNDLSTHRVTSGSHATHSLVRRSYVEEYGTIDEPGRMLHEGYDHQFVDNELVETARFREQWTFCRYAMVEHLHPHWGKASQDATYAKGQARFADDRRLFTRRQRLWR